MWVPMPEEPLNLDVEGASRLARALSEDTPTHGTDVLAGYTLLRLLGEGGGGRVYQAVRAGSEHPVALKVIHAAADPGRARREYEILQSLRLPCTPRLLDFGVTGSAVYIATEFIEGRPLDQACAGLDIRGRVELLARACDAVQSLHEHGVIHRDLKPSNMLITAGPHPVVMLVDLGIAAVGDTHTLTQTGTVFGTVAFMSPEQARGERTSTRSDVYSLGATAYQVLAGSTPHDTKTALTEAIRRVGMEEARDPLELNPQLPKSLAAVLRKACAHRPTERYDSAAALGADLRRFLAGEPVLAAPASVWQRLMRRAARHPVVVTALANAAVGVTSLGLTAFSNWWFFRQPVRLIASEDKTEARLMSRSGAVIRSWRSDVREREGTPVKVATLARLPSGGRVGLLSAMYGEEFGPAQRSLACFRLEDLTNPLGTSLWVSGVGPPDIEAPSEIGEVGDDFFVGEARVADVFGHIPGEEVVAFHRHRRYGRSAVRVYELTTGRVLHEAWHSGAIMGILPTADEKGSLILILGVSNAHAVPNRLIPGTDKWDYPLVMFALRPVQGVRAGVVNLRCAEPSRPEPQVEWYRFLRLDASYWHVADWSIRPTNRADGHHEIEAYLQHPQRESNTVPTAFLIVSTDGRLIRIGTNDAYRNQVGAEAPPDRSWSLEPEPWWEVPPFTRASCRPWP
jgi:predicted Ser/Thr protein kinase